MSHNHSILIPLADKQVPLFLFRDSVNLLLQLFKVTGYPSLRIGYDSIGADCATNNLHVHVIYAACMFKKYF